MRKKETGSRRKSREKALQILFHLDFYRDDIDKVCEEFWEGNRIGRKVREYAEQLVKGACANLKPIDDAIISTLEHWSFDRLASVDKAILRYAVYELLYVPDVPQKVTINEAVEIAKEYGAEESGAFVNGILDKIKNELDEQTALTGPPDADKE